MVGTLACLFVFLVPFFPDEKLIRLKLEAFEIGIFILSFAVGLRAIWLQRSTAFHLSRLSWAVLGWMVVHIFLWTVAEEKSLATTELRRVVLAFCAYGCFSLSVLTTNEERRFFWCWWGAASLLAIYGLLQFTGGVGILAVPQMDRVMGTYGNPIFFAAFLVPAIFVTSHLWSIESSDSKKAILIAGLLLQSVALYLTKTRAAWLAVVITGILVLFSKVGFRKIPKWVRIGGVVIIGVFLFQTRSVWLRDQGHLLIWRDTLRMWKAHPLTGVGLGAFHTNLPSYAQPDLLSKWPTGQFIVNYAHNEYLQTLAETGLIGFVAFLAVLIIYFNSKRPMDLLSFAVLALLIQNLFSVDMRYGMSFATCFLLMGLSTRTKESIPEASVIKRNFPFRIGLSAVWVVFLVGYIGPRLLAPYRAQKEVSVTPSFFDERLLDPAKSIGDLEKLAAEYPEEPSVLEKLAYVYAKEIRTPDNKINQAMASKAVQTYSELIRIDPKRSAAYNNLANVKYTIGQVDEALVLWNKAVEVDPNFLDVHLNLGKILYTHGELKESARHFEKVLSLDPGNAEAVVYLKRMIE